MMNSTTGFLIESRVAIVHDSFAENEQADFVLHELATMLPGADILSALRVDEPLTKDAPSRTLRSTWMRHLPVQESTPREYLVFHPFAIKALDLSQYDVVVSNCGGFAKTAKHAETAVHICYCHATAHFAEHRADRSSEKPANSATHIYLKPLLAGLRHMDVRYSGGPDYYIAKSRVVAEQIKGRYGRNSYVVYPPIDISKYHVRSNVGDHLLIVSSLTPHKRIDLVIAACNSVHKPLLIVGDGPDKARLEALAGPTIQFLGWRTDDELVDLLAHCEAVFCPDVEKEFDAMPLKANASGRPAISYAAGTALETIADGETGVLCRQYSRPAVVDAIESCGRLTWDPALLQAHTRRFDVEAFRGHFATVLNDIVGDRLMPRAAV
jgi:glycosyltransferase involved in cell wall biosynthesis